MSIVSQEVEVPEDNPFANDLLSRQEFADALTRLFKNSPNGPVIALNAKWGAGKSTFARMWLQSFKNQGGRALYLNTFEYDYVSDPFLLLASVLNSEFKGQFGESNSDEVKTFQKAAVDVGKHILSWGLKAGVRAATMNVIDEKAIEQLGDLPDKMMDGISDSLASYVENKLEGIELERKSLESFRESLSKMGEIAIQETGSPFVIVLDELDRCRPSFAVETIERVKHFFSVPNVAFFLVMNRTQIEEAVKAQYGAGIDALTYLQKFIDIEAEFPIDSKGQGTNVGQIVKWALDSTGCNWFKGRDGLAGTLEMTAKTMDLSYRDIIKVVQHLSLLYKSIEENRLQMPDIFALIAVLKVKFPSDFELLKKGEITLEEATNKMKILDSLPQEESKWLANHISLLSMPRESLQELEHDDERIQGSRWLFTQYRCSDPHNLPKEFCRWMEEFKFLDPSEAMSPSVFR